jgi:AraC-like DNA-binding protein
MSTAPHQRSAIPMSLVRASFAGIKQKGIDLRPMLRAIDLDPNEFEGDGWLEPSRFARLITTAGRYMKDEGLGFMARPFRPGTFSMMCHATISAPNLRRSLLRGSRYFRLMRDDLVLTPTERGEECVVFLEFPQGSAPDPYLIESLFIVLIRWASWMIDANILLNRISTTFDPPEYVDQYQAMFPGHHFFAQRQNYIAFSSHYLSMPVVQDSQSLVSFLAGAPAALLRQHRHDVSLTGQVKKMIAAADPPDLSLDQAAANLNLSEQTLRRRLRAEGAHFQQIKDHLRRDQAVFLLLHEQASVNQVAEQLGFSEPSTFHRAFKKWTGMAPGEYRDAYGKPGE